MIFHGTSAELSRLLADLPGVLSGRLPDHSGAVRGLLHSIGVAVLGQVQQDYVVKSEGRVDSTGEAWEPLSALTLAMRRVVTSQKALQRLAGTRGELTARRAAALDANAKRLEQLLRGTSPKARAQRRQALRVLRRRQGELSPKEYQRLERLLSGKTRKSAVDKVIVAAAWGLILRDTGRLLQSLTPLVGGSEQILEVGPGYVDVGSSTDYLKYHQSKRPRRVKKDGTPRLPRRRVLPDTDPLPDSYQRVINTTLRDGLSSGTFWHAYLGGRAS